MTPTRNRLSWVALLCSLVAGGLMVYYADQVSLAEFRSDQIIENTPVGIMVCDTNGHAVRVNKALSAITGFTAEELLTGGAMLLVPEEYREQHTTKFAAAIDGYAHASNTHDIAYTKILAVTCKDGLRIRATVSVSTIRNGRAVEFFAFITPLPSVAHDLTRDNPGPYKN